MTTLAKVSLCTNVTRSDNDTLKCTVYPDGIPKVTDQFGFHIDGSVCESCTLFKNTLSDSNK